LAGIARVSENVTLTASRNSEAGNTETFSGEQNATKVEETGYG